MKVNALLMCREQPSLRILAAALDALEIEQEVCHTAPEALELLALGHYSSLVLDYDLPAAAHVARMARLAPPQRRPVVFAMIGVRTDVAGAFQSGANFVLYKPLALEQVFRSLRAGRGFMRADRRRSPRHKVEALVYLRFGDICPLPAIVLDLSEKGLAVQAAEPLPATQVPLRFILPGTSNLIDGTGEVIWTDESGRAGIDFVHLSAASRKHLRAWTGKRGRKKVMARVAPGSHKVRVSASALH